MSERTHSPTVEAKAGSKRRLAVVIGGTAAAVLTAGVVFQIFRAETAQTGEDQAARVKLDNPADAAAASSPNRRPLAKVNRQFIYWEEVARECMERYGRDVLDNIVNRTIIQQSCRERGIVVTNEEVHAEVNKIARKFKLDADNWYKMLQAERNITPLQYQRDIIWPMLALRKLANEDINVTENEMIRAFHRDYGPRVKARMIMFDNERRAREVWAEANRTPEEFGRLARKHSVEQNSAALDGTVPPIRKYIGNENLWQSAFRLKENEISGIIEVSQPGVKRYVVLKCEGYTEPQVKSLDDQGIREIIYSQLMEEKTQQSVATIFDKMKSTARVDNYLTNTSTGGVQQTAGSYPQAPGATATRAQQQQQYPRSATRPAATPAKRK